MVASEEVASINMIPSGLDGEANWELASLKRGLDLHSRASIFGDYERLCEAAQ